MRIGRPIPELVIAAEDKGTALQNWARRPKSARIALALRAKIILACSEGKVQHPEVARHFRITKQMVGKWRARICGKWPRRATG